MFVCVVPLSQPSSRDLVYPLLGCFVSEKKQYIKRSKKNPKAVPSLTIKKPIKDSLTSILLISAQRMISDNWSVRVISLVESTSIE